MSANFHPRSPSPCQVVDDGLSNCIWYVLYVVPSAGVWANRKKGELSQREGNKATNNPVALDTGSMERRAEGIQESRDKWPFKPFVIIDPESSKCSKKSSVRHTEPWVMEVQ
jgi:hypothetical protein